MISAQRNPSGDYIEEDMGRYFGYFERSVLNYVRVRTASYPISESTIMIIYTYILISEL